MLMTVIDSESPVAAAARAFAAEAWSALRQLGVVPPSPYRRHLRVGRDYEGGDLMCLRTYTALEKAIKAAYPRFSEQTPLGERRFAGMYIFPFVETYIARLETSPPNAADSPVATAIRDLEAGLGADDYEVVCCRVVSHMTTSDGRPVAFANVRVVPIVEEAHDHTRRLMEIFEGVIPGGARAYADDTDLRGLYAPPEVAVIAHGSNPSLHDLGSAVSQRVERFLLLVRLLKPGSSESMFEVKGSGHPVRPPQPRLVKFRGAGPVSFSFTPLAARDIVLSVDDIHRVDGLDRLLADVEGAQSGMVFTSFGLALGKFTLSYHSYAWFEQVVDLATAFEAAISGQNSNDVGLRLRTRAAALLVTASDSATDIFNDIKVLYDLRSRLVHGGSMSQRTLLNRMRSLSTLPAGVSQGEMPAHAVERLRDLARRAILARICLASGGAPLWPIKLKDDDEVDAALAEDSGRVQWRDAWHHTLASINALESTERPLAA